MSSPAIDADRLWAAHMEMAGIGTTQEGGGNRQALSAEDVEARRAVAMERGLRASIAAIAARRRVNVAIDPYTTRRAVCLRCVAEDAVP